MPAKAGIKLAADATPLNSSSAAWFTIGVLTFAGTTLLV
jgi:hypothetical protein